MPDGQIARMRNGQEWEIPIDFKVDEIHFGTNQHDDPSYCALSDKVRVAADVIDDSTHDEPRFLWKQGETLILTEDERKILEEEEFQRECEERQEIWAEAQWRGRED